MELSFFNRLIKRTFDIILALLCLILLFWVIIIVWIISSIFHRRNGIFTQTRIGRNGSKFRIFKIRTMADDHINTSTITTSKDSRITEIGKILRKYKLDELPQLFNVLWGSMSFVGPRPDVEGYADKLIGEERAILTLRPGITGPATLQYRDEEIILSKAKNLQEENSRIYRNKVKINIEYLKNWSLTKDIKYIFKTFL